MYHTDQWLEHSQPLAERSKLHERAAKWLGGLVHRVTADRTDRAIEKRGYVPRKLLVAELDEAIWNAGRRLQAAERSWQFRRGDPNSFDPDVLKPWESQPSPEDLDIAAHRRELWLAQKAMRAVEQERGYKWVGQWLDDQIKTADRDLLALGTVFANPSELQAAAEEHGVKSWFEDYKTSYAEYVANLHMQGGELAGGIRRHQYWQENLEQSATPSVTMGLPKPPEQPKVARTQN